GRACPSGRRRLGYSSCPCLCLVGALPACAKAPPPSASATSAASAASARTIFLVCLTICVSLSVQGRPGKRGVRVDVVGVVGGGGCVRAVVGGGVVRAGARPYLGPRPGVAPGRR